MKGKSKKEKISKRRQRNTMSENEEKSRTKSRRGTDDEGSDDSDISSVTENTI